VHCHLLDFVCYTPYSGIIFLTVEYRIYWNSIYRCCWNVPTNEWRVHSWKVKVIILCHIWVYAVSSRYFLSPFASTCVHPRFFLWGSCCSYLVFFVLSFCVSLRSGFRVVLSVAISAEKRCSVRRFRIVVSKTYCVVFFYILCALCCQFHGIVHLWLPLRCSPTLISSLLFPLIPPIHNIVLQDIQIRPLGYVETLLWPWKINFTFHSGWPSLLRISMSLYDENIYIF